MFESRSKVTELRSNDMPKISQESEKKLEDLACRYPMTDALIRILNCKLSETFVPETYAELIALSLCRRAIKFGGVREIREIWRIAEGPSAQAIYDLWSIVETATEVEKRPVFNPDDSGQRSTSVA
jgi:hypothetical protein